MSWLLAFAGFALLIVLHEFGHFAAAKLTGMRVERFFLFFPPKLVSVKRGETEYGIGAIPLGGFCKITGMNPDEVREPDATGGTDAAPEDQQTTAADDEESASSGNPAQTLIDRIEGPSEVMTPEVRARAYYNQPVWKRIVVIAAGPAMNLLIAFLILFGLAFGANKVIGSGLEVGGPEPIVAGSPADGKLEPGDRIVSVDGVAASNLDYQDRASRLRDQIGSHTCAGEPTDGCAATTPATVVVDRDGRRLSLEITPEYKAKEERSLLGFRMQAADVAPINPSVPGAARISVDFMWLVTSRTASTFAQLFKPEKREEISSVVGAYETTRQQFEIDTRTALTLIAVISLSLAIINLFPFLPLDGGHIFWSLVEKIRGRAVPFAVMERAGVVGFMLIIFIFLIGFTNDIGRFTSGEGFGGR